jgi:hypothetical protein
VAGSILGISKGFVSNGSQSSTSHGNPVCNRDGLPVLSVVRGSDSFYHPVRVLNRLLDTKEPEEK